MDEKYEDTYDPKNPPNSLLWPRRHSVALPWFIAGLVAVIALVGVIVVFYTAGSADTAVEQEPEKAVGTSGYYSSEGGHDPVRRPHSTKDELKFRGFTQPSEARGR